MWLKERAATFAPLCNLINICICFLINKMLYLLMFYILGYMLSHFFYTRVLLYGLEKKLIMIFRDFLLTKKNMLCTIFITIELLLSIKLYYNYNQVTWYLNVSQAINIQAYNTNINIQWLQWHHIVIKINAYK